MGPNRTACFTGHRPSSLEGGYDKESPPNQKIIAFLVRAVQRLKGEGFRTFIAGGALGIDQWAADVVLGDPELELVIALPFKGYGGNWPAESQAVLTEQLRRAKKIHVVCEGDYAPWKNTERNRWMVLNSEAVVAVFRGGNKGGTAHCFGYALKNGRRILRYNPDTSEETETSTLEPEMEDISCPEPGIVSWE